MPTHHLNTLDPWLRRVLLVAGILDAGFRVAALIDIVPRPSTQVNGSKAVWISALLTISSVGIVPAAYFTRGRRS